MGFRKDLPKDTLRVIERRASGLKASKLEFTSVVEGILNREPTDDSREWVDVATAAAEQARTSAEEILATLGRASTYFAETSIRKEDASPADEGQDRVPQTTS